MLASFQLDTHPDLFCKLHGGRVWGGARQEGGDCTEFPSESSVPAPSRPVLAFIIIFPAASELRNTHIDLHICRLLSLFSQTNSGSVQLPHRFEYLLCSEPSSPQATSQSICIRFLAGTFLEPLFLSCCAFTAVCDVSGIVRHFRFLQVFFNTPRVCL